MRRSAVKELLCEAANGDLTLTRLSVGNLSLVITRTSGASIETELSSHELWKVIRTIGRRDHGYFANILWRTREWLDVLFGGGKPFRRYSAGAELAVGDYIDS